MINVIMLYSLHDYYNIKVKFECNLKSTVKIQDYKIFLRSTFYSYISFISYILLLYIYERVIALILIYKF